MMILHLSAWLSRNVPFLRRRIRHIWYEALSKRDWDQIWTVMNYGFAGLETDGKLMPLEPRLEPERYCLQLYHHVVGDIELKGRDVLEVGCGRGGGAAWLHRTCRPRSYTGMDYSRKAIRFCKATFQEDGLIFAFGDAESIPFLENSFDIIINAESSNCYQSMVAFLANVKRVLRPGGYFLFADYRHGRQVAALQRSFKQSGLVVLQEQDITPNIIRGLELDRPRMQALIEAIAPCLFARAARDLAAGEDSFAWKSLVSGHTRYLSAVLQHPVD
jgi:ubiquinone/menaquinone biosynthesis C-methylase UbiE